MNIDKDKTYIGKYKSAYSDEHYFSIDKNTRSRHLYSIGLTGSGKTTLLENIIAQDVFSGKGLCVIDPHGDMSQNILKSIPKNRVNDVVYINLIDEDYPVGINPLQCSSSIYSRSLVASSLVSTFKNLWSDS